MHRLVTFDVSFCSQEQGSRSNKSLLSSQHNCCVFQGMEAAATQVSNQRALASSTMLLQTTKL